MLFKNLHRNSKSCQSRAAALIIAVLLTFGAVLAPAAVFAEPDTQSSDSETGSSTTQKSNNNSSSKSETKNTDTDDDKQNSDSSKSSKKSSSDNKSDDEESDDEAEATPKPTKNPRLDENGRPVLSDNECAVLVDARTGEVLFEQNSEKQVYPASTTKIMTALLVLEAIERGEIHLNSAYLITPDMLEGLATDGSSMLLKEGEAMTVQYLLEGLLVESGNDAAQALAIIVCGDVPTFVQRMNDKAAALGLSGTHFMNPHGLHDDEHYTTAADLCELTKAAMKNKTFRNIVAMSQAIIPATEKTGSRTFINTNGLLSTLKYPNYYYKNATGVKTGHTSQAGFCLVSSAQEGALEVISVLMNSATEDDRHYNSRNMLAYAIDNFKAVTPIKRDDMLTEVKVRFGTGSDHTTLSVSKDITVTVPEDTEEEDLEIRYVLPDYIAAPVETGDKVGTVEVVLDNKVVGTGDLLADMTVKRHPLGFLMQFFAFIWSFWIVRILIIAIVLGLIIFVIYMTVNIRRNLKLAKRSRRRSKRNKSK